MSENMVERVARALEAVIWEYKDSSVSFQSHQLARAAIEAMREPTESMVDEATIEGCPPRIVWSIMIDDALSEKP